MNVLDKEIWYEVQPSKKLDDLLGYLNSISAYNCYLEDHKIEKGSEKDPLQQFKEVALSQDPNATYDFITPYFVVVLGKKMIYTD